MCGCFVIYRYVPRSTADRGRTPGPGANVNVECRGGPGGVAASTPRVQETCPRWVSRPADRMHT
eukprot:scaffold2354_cov124-Isochrysis_galbana.AAC.6